MVLRSDLNLPRIKVFNGMIAAAVTEFQLVRFCSLCKGYYLMSETYAEQRIFPDQFFYRPNGFGYVRRISRTVGYENAVRMQTFDNGGVCVPRYDGHSAMSF